ncbi:helix-hairpin-helix domain-containing protein [Bordetella genomosp. 9]|uniref:helix-hairpin-helix domain-containing protein n=1 Tax=Bordetella genomosp. 9 TaxID=1416803 RepID=UPI0018DF23EA|nr:hypothetical protein [Bordetella genomosp. 9]
MAKIYNKEIGATKAAKLGAMQRLLSPKLQLLTAWPIELLRSSTGEIVGFLMVNLSGSKDIHRLYSPKSRLSDFPHADWRLLVRAALNTARAFAVLHDAGCVIGDVNHGGIRVNGDATVTLIDCDSFQICTPEADFPCEVGVDNFTPPELQGKSFKNILRTANHDNFGLAVMVFLILQMGRHPFAGRYQGPGDLTIGEAIAQYRYAYSRDRARTAMSPPPVTVSPTVSSELLADLWEKAFSPGGSAPSGRPSAAEWVAALSKLEASFRRCTANPAHYYFAGCRQCPWCPIEATGLVLFGRQANVPLTRGNSAFDINAIWTQITSITVPRYTAPPSVPHVPAAAAVLKARNRDNMWRHAAIIVSLTVVVAGIAIKAQFWHTWAAISFALGRWLHGQAGHIDIPALEKRVEQAKRAYEDLSRRWKTETAAQAFMTKLETLRRLREEWVALPAEQRKQYEKLVANRQQLALQQFLDQHDIEAAVIHGIGPNKKSMLQSYGIETAWDVNRATVLAVPGFGPALTDKLMQWRRSLEAKFRFDPQAAVDPRQVSDLHRAIASRRSAIEAELVKGKDDLLMLARNIVARRKALESPLGSAAAELGQAQANLEAIRR